MREKKKRKYWIHSYTQECPSCGIGDTYRERRYTKKPKDWKDRNEFVEVYDYCDSL